MKVQNVLGEADMTRIYKDADLVLFDSCILTSESTILIDTFAIHNAMNLNLAASKRRTAYIELMTAFLTHPKARTIPEVLDETTVYREGLTKSFGYKMRKATTVEKTRFGKGGEEAAATACTVLRQEIDSVYTLVHKLASMPLLPIPDQYYVDTILRVSEENNCKQSFTHRYNSPETLKNLAMRREQRHAPDRCTDERLIAYAVDQAMGGNQVHIMTSDSDIGAILRAVQLDDEIALTNPGLRDVARERVSLTSVYNSEAFYTANVPALGFRVPPHLAALGEAATPLYDIMETRLLME